MLLRTLRLHRLLSFGPDAGTIALGPLNILIGPNGSGKSNLLDAISLLRAAPRELVDPIRDGGGVRAWVWQGPGTPRAEIEAVVCNESESRADIRHRIAFIETNQRFHIDDERVEFAQAKPPQERPYMFFGYEHGRPLLNTTAGDKRALRPDQIDPQKSILAQRRDPDQYPELSYLGDAYSAIRMYRAWTFGRSSPPRHPQPTDQPSDFLLEDASNLGLILNGFRLGDTKAAVLAGLRRVYDGVEDYAVRILGGTVQLFLEERGGRLIPATRLSDGTLRWLALLAILLDPNPPRLICIEEPELGLHPDLIPDLARMLRSASERTQLVVTTHSNELVDAFSDAPESVLICERHEASTTMRRLDRAQLSTWLESYSLGELWMKGELGGTRW